MSSQEELGGNNPAIKRHFELQIKTLLQNAPIEMQRSWKHFYKSKTKRTEAAGAMTARNYVEYIFNSISLTVVHDKLHFIIHIDE